MELVHREIASLRPLLYPGDQGFHDPPHPPEEHSGLSNGPGSSFTGSVSSGASRNYYPEVTSTPRSPPPCRKNGNCGVQFGRKHQSLLKRALKDLRTLSNFH